MSETHETLIERLRQCAQDLEDFGVGSLTPTEVEAMARMREAAEALAASPVQPCETCETCRFFTKTGTGKGATGICSNSMLASYADTNDGERLIVWALFGCTLHQPVVPSTRTQEPRK